MSGVFLSVLVSALSECTVCSEINIDLISVFAISNFFLQCTLLAKDGDATKNPAVDLELILMHHFSRILCLESRC